MRIDSEIGGEMRIGIIGEKGAATRPLAHTPPPADNGEREIARRDQRDKKDPRDGIRPLRLFRLFGLFGRLSPCSPFFDKRQTAVFVSRFSLLTSHLSLLTNPKKGNER